MSTEHVLKDILNKTGLSITNKILILLSINSKEPKSTEEIVKLGYQFGLTAAGKWNISQHLRSTGGKAIKTPKGWELTLTGIQFLYLTFGVEIDSQEIHIANDLRSHLPKIKNQDTLAFVTESVLCLESKLYRSAVVLSWVGAIAVLYDYVIVNKLKEFNIEATRRDPKWKNAKVTDDLSLLKESEFLDILENISVIGNDVKKELKKCLDLRNSCGHPNSLVIADNRVAAHIEILVLNVFAKFI
ncbi:hypothetical protein MUP32_03285 [Candidatus Microgenomates bacterium]|nr:hypothetical protein [Candidatus Microgenomates bacterium]